MNAELEKRYKGQLDSRDRALAEITELEASIEAAEVAIIAKRKLLLKIAARVELLEEDGATLVRPVEDSAILS